MQDEWQQTNQIVMAVQTAELRQHGIAEKQCLHVSCSLVNIARGQCFLEIKPGETSTKFEKNLAKIGIITIEIDRPIIQGVVTVPGSLYDTLVKRLSSTPPRPVAINLSIAQKLAVSLEGDLRINEVTQVAVNDLSVTLPLK